MLKLHDSVHLSNKYLETCSLLSAVQGAMDSTVNLLRISEIFFKVLGNYKNLIYRPFSRGMVVREAHSNHVHFLHTISGKL